MKQKVTRKTPIGEITAKFPKAIEVLQNKGFHCVGCPGAAMESLENGAKGHGMNEEEVDALIDEINKALNEE